MVTFFTRRTWAQPMMMWPQGSCTTLSLVYCHPLTQKCHESFSVFFSFFFLIHFRNSSWTRLGNSQHSFHHAPSCCFILMDSPPCLALWALASWCKMHHTKLPQTLDTKNPVYWEIHRAFCGGDGHISTVLTIGWRLECNRCPFICKSLAFQL